MSSKEHKEVVQSQAVEAVEAVEEAVEEVVEEVVEETVTVHEEPKPVLQQAMPKPVLQQAMPKPVLQQAMPTKKEFPSFRGKVFRCDFLNVRSFPAMDASVIAKLPKGKVVNVTFTEDAEWLAYNDGFVNANFVEAI